MSPYLVLVTVHTLRASFLPAEIYRLGVSGQFKSRIKRAQILFLLPQAS